MTGGIIPADAIHITEKLRDFGLYALNQVKVYPNTAYASVGASKTDRYSVEIYGYVKPSTGGVVDKVKKMMQGMDSGAVAAVVIVMLLIVALSVFAILRFKGFLGGNKSGAFYGDSGGKGTSSPVKGYAGSRSPGGKGARKGPAAYREGGFV